MIPRRQLDGERGKTYRIKPRRPIEEIRGAIRGAQPPIEQGQFRKPALVELVTLDPAIKLEIRYATANNFLGVPVYTAARAFLQRPAAEALVRVHRRLEKDGYGLLVHDAYRPWEITKLFWEATPDEGRIFVADPAKGSKHNRGCAVDLTLYERSTGQPVQMVGGYDEFSPRSYPDYPGGTSLQRWHRELLRRAMEAEGFTVNEFEWWHFDYRDWAEYPIMNVELRTASGRGSEGGGLAMQFTSQNLPPIENVSEADLDRAFESLAIGRHAQIWAYRRALHPSVQNGDAVQLRFAEDHPEVKKILEFIRQTGTKPWFMECVDSAGVRECPLEEYFTLEQVKRTFVAFLRGDPSWRRDYSWVPVTRHPRWTREFDITEAEWKSFTLSTTMLELLRPKGSETNFRRFMIACCRRIWSHVQDERLRQAVEVAERDVEGRIADDERVAAARSAAHRACRGIRAPRCAARQRPPLSCSLCRGCVRLHARGSAGDTDLQARPRRALRLCNRRGDQQRLCGRDFKGSWNSVESRHDSFHRRNGHRVCAMRPDPADLRVSVRRRLTSTVDWRRLCLAESCGLRGT